MTATTEIIGTYRKVKRMGERRSLLERRKYDRRTSERRKNEFERRKQENIELRVRQFLGNDLAKRIGPRGMFTPGLGANASKIFAMSSSLVKHFCFQEKNSSNNGSASSIQNKIEDLVEESFKERVDAGMTIEHMVEKLLTHYDIQSTSRRENTNRRNGERRSLDERRKKDRRTE